MSLTQMWRTLLGLDAEIQRASDVAYLNGFMAGLKTQVASAKGPTYLRGFVDGRESVRTIPLDQSSSEDGDVCQLH